MNREDQLDAILFDLKLAAEVTRSQAGTSNDELYANQHLENGVPVTDGDLKPPERQNINAIREALETQVEMEVGKPIQQKQQEVGMQEKVQDAALAQGAGSLAGDVGVKEVSAKPGTQIIINVGSKKEAVNLRVNGKDRRFEFSSIAARDAFVKEAFAKFGSKILLITTPESL